MSKKFENKPTETTRLEQHGQRESFAVRFDYFARMPEGSTLPIDALNTALKHIILGEEIYVRFHPGGYTKIMEARPDDLNLPYQVRINKITIARGATEEQTRAAAENAFKSWVDQAQKDPRWKNFVYQQIMKFSEEKKQKIEEERTRVEKEEKWRREYEENQRKARELLGNLADLLDKHATRVVIQFFSGEDFRFTPPKPSNNVHGEFQDPKTGDFYKFTKEDDGTFKIEDNYGYVGSPEWLDPTKYGGEKINTTADTHQVETPLPAKQDKRTELSSLEPAEHLGVLENCALLAGSSTWRKDTTLITLISAHPNNNRLIRELREAVAKSNLLDVDKVIRAVTIYYAKTLGENFAGTANMTDNSNWRPDTVSRVAKTVGIDEFVDTLVATISSRSG